MTRMFLDRLREHSRTQPNKVAIELLAAGEARVLRYGELEVNIQRTMGWLRALGLGPGDCAATQLPTCLAFVQLHLAICRLGAIHLPLNPAFPGRSYATSSPIPARRCFPCSGQPVRNVNCGNHTRPALHCPAR